MLLIEMGPKGWTTLWLVLFFSWVVRGDNEFKIKDILDTEAWRNMAAEKICVNNRAAGLVKEVTKAIVNKQKNGYGRAYDLIKRGFMCRASKYVALIAAYCRLSLKQLQAAQAGNTITVYTMEDELASSIALNLVQVLDVIVWWTKKRFLIKAASAFDTARKFMVRTLSSHTKYDLPQALSEIKTHFNRLVAKNCPCNRNSTIHNLYSGGGDVHDRIEHRYTTITSADDVGLVIDDGKQHGDAVGDFDKTDRNRRDLVESALNEFCWIPDSWESFQLRNTDKTKNLSNPSHFSFGNLQ